MKQNKTIKIGEINILKIARDTEYGFYLESIDGKEVLLPNAYIIEDEMPIGSLLEVFIYTDSEDRLVASTKYPYAMLGEIGYFTVVDLEQYGAFVNWGLPKDLFVPLSQQKERFRVGKKYILRVCLDEKSNRLYATQKIGKYFNKDTKRLHPNLSFKAIVIAKTPLGCKVVANNQYEGMLFNNEIFTKLNIGDKIDVFVKKVRDDGKLDLSLQPIGKNAKKSQAEDIILKALKDAGGKLNFTYKSDAQKIQKLFNISKKSFKSALTQLIEKDKIKLLDNSIEIK